MYSLLCENTLKLQPDLKTKHNECYLQGNLKFNIQCERQFTHSITFLS